MSNQIQTPVSKSRPVIILGTIAAVATTLVTVLAAVPQVPAWVAIVVGAVGAVATAVVSKLTEGQTVPANTVVAQRNDETGDIVAGLASTVETGRVVDDVTPSGPSPYTPPA